MLIEYIWTLNLDFSIGQCYFNSHEIMESFRNSWGIEDILGL